jgi:hypothetical protein
LTYREALTLNVWCFLQTRPASSQKLVEVIAGRGFSSFYFTPGCDQAKHLDFTGAISTVQTSASAER